MTDNTQATLEKKQHSSRKETSTVVAGDDTTIISFGTNELERYIDLVKIIANRMKAKYPSHTDLDELISLGNSGLAQALQSYDRTRGAAFETYASIRIRGAILDGLRRSDTLPRHTRGKYRQLQKTIEELEQEHGREPTEEEICTRMNLTARQFSMLRGKTQPATLVRLDAQTDNTGRDLQECIADDDQATADALLEDKEIRSLLVERISRLPDREQKILSLYYYENATFAEIAQAIGCCESRVCQLHSQSIEKLRTYVQQISRGYASRQKVATAC